MTKIELADLIDLEYQMRADESLDRRELRRRDRKIGLLLSPSLRDDKRALFLAWLSEIRESAKHLPGKRAENAIGTIAFFLILFGLVLGYGAARVVFYYDGARPINVINALAVFVLLQVVILFLFGFAMLPSPFLRRLPGARFLQDVARLLSPARLMPLLSRILPPRYRRALGAGWGRLKSFDILYGNIRLWLLANLSQNFALAFQVGALAGCLWLIVGTDLAFAWSTTLEIEAADFHRLTNAVALPWREFASQAAPSLELVEASRFFRHNNAYIGFSPEAGAEPGVAWRGVWWRFLVAGMLFYGLLPRLLTKALSAARYRHALGGARLDHAAFHELYERLLEPLVESQGVGPEEVGGGRVTETKTDALAGAEMTPAGALVRWEGLDVTDDETLRLFAERFGPGERTVLDAGGADLAADRETLEALANMPKGRSAAILVKAWEPPTRDLANFINSIRRQRRAETPILILPVDLDDAGQCVAPEPADMDHWQGKMMELDDPWLRTSRLVRES